MTILRFEPKVMIFFLDKTQIESLLSILESARATTRT